MDNINLDTNLLFSNIEKQQLLFVNDSLKDDITRTVNSFFPNLNNDDLKIITLLTIFIVDIISYKYNFKKEDLYYKQWTQNGCRDIKGAILLLLPFIDDKNNGYLLKKINNLNQLLYAKNQNNINSSILQLQREQILSTYFEYGNMGIGLIPPNTNSSNILELYPNNEKLIYKIIHHNLIGLLQTLEIINGKSYINWINIVPLNLNNYTESDIYKNTAIKINEYYQEFTLDYPLDKFNNLISSNLLYYSGLWIGEFYNVLRNKYYEEIKSIKWLIYPYETDNDKYYLLQGLNKLFNVNSILTSNNNNFDDLLPNQQNDFEKSVRNLNITLSEPDIEIIKYLLVFLINNYSNKYEIKDDRIINKFKLKETTEENDIGEFSKTDTNIINDISNEDVINCLEIFKTNYIKHIWNFLKETLDLLKTTAYWKFLITDNKINNIYYYKSFNKTNKESILNLKNIYNIAKALSHNSLKEWNLLPNNYISLTDTLKKDFFEKLFELRKLNSWLSLNNNLRLQYKFSNAKKYDLLEIYRSFQGNFVPIVFEELITNGLLNKFQVNLEITNKQLLPSETTIRKTKIKELLKQNFNKNKDDWLESYYYLSNEKFKDIPKFRLENRIIVDPNNKYVETDYFDIISKDQEWPIFYAMDWISQISFFQHYIYHQVLYVTGATGQGKSTQVPKLLLYALKMIDNKSNGKIICTQPRVPPTVNNATRIAEELGYPIEQVSNATNIKIRTNNYYVQFKYKHDSHINTKSNSYLRIVTDGTLFEEMKKNIVMKETFNKPSEETKYSNNNRYDIIIVDEAHEHNINMDLIIALGRQTCYLNNQIKLIIVSATMDDDEPIYRRYFYNINDKLSYPIKSPIKHPLLENNNFLAEPIYMDRRYHISPPGETTQYRVDEVYDNAIQLVYDSNRNIDHKKSALKVQEIGYNKVIEICNKTIDGEILFFANGTAEIYKAVEYLNNILPPGNIALPYLSNLNPTYKNIIEKIDYKISTIKNKRENIHLEWTADYIEDMSVPNGIYKRAIIIATNVAEASVTIPRLTYVIDNGYAKVNKYNKEITYTELIVEEISESSRLQRKGRVGRIKDGTVYYMYKKDAKKDIKPKYKITQEDIASTFISLLGDKNIKDIDISDYQNVNKKIVDDMANPNEYLFFMNKDNINKQSYIYKSNLYDIYIKNYYNLFPKDYKQYFEYDNKKLNNFNYEFMIHNDGQIMDTVIDLSGRFYLIHPFENDIKRNVLNEIFAYNFNNKIIYTNKIPYIEYRYLLMFLLQNNLLIDKDMTNIFIYKNINIKSLVKSDIADKVLKLSSFMSGEESTSTSNIQNAISLIAANAYGCLNDVVEIIILMNALGFDISKISNINWNLFKKRYADYALYNVDGPIYKSDIIFLYNIIKIIKKEFNNDIFSIKNNDIECGILLNKFNNLKEPTPDFNPLLWNKLTVLKANGKLKSEYIKITNEVVFKNIPNNINLEYRIKDFCARYNLNPLVVTTFIDKTRTYYLKNEYHNNETLLWAKEFSINYKKYLFSDKIEEKIIRSFLFGKPYQYTYYIDNKGLTTMVNNTFLKISLNNINSFIPNTSTIVFYLMKGQTPKIDNKLEDFPLALGYLNEFDIRWLIPIQPLYFNHLYTPDVLYSIQNNNIEFVNSNDIQKIKRTLSNYWSKDINIWHDNRTPILQYFYNKVLRNIGLY